MSYLFVLLAITCGPNQIMVWECETRESEDEPLVCVAKCVDVEEQSQ